MTVADEPTPSPSPADTGRVVIAGCDVLVRPGELRPGAGLVLDDGRVAAVGPLDPGEVSAGTVVLDGRGLLAMPGLVNAHTHSPENCLRGAGQRLPLEPWLLLMFEVGGLYDADAHRVCALAGAAEMLRTGTTAVLDHLWMTPPHAGAIDATMAAYRDAGIRAAVAPLMSDADTTQLLGEALGVDVSAAQIPVLPTDELLDCLADAMRRWHGGDGGRLQLFAGPGGVQWASEQLLQGAVELARRHGSGFHVHLLETTVQDALCRRRFGCSGLQALDRLGILGPDVSLPHSVWIDADDIDTIAARGAVVVHNPAANTRLGSGRAPVPELLEAGATVALGADGSASSDNQVMWDEVKLAALIHNDGLADRWVDGAQALTMATTGGAAALGHRADGLGTLVAGAPADVVLLDRRGSGLAGSVDLEGTLALSEDGRSVRHVFVGGRQVVGDGVCLTIDEPAVLAELAELAAERVARHRNPSPRLRTAMAQMRTLRAALARQGSRA
jgi:5-methylthioadenosine/S-adenosylhomocysteine deaminase